MSWRRGQGGQGYIGPTELLEALPRSTPPPQHTHTQIYIYIYNLGGLHFFASDIRLTATLNRSFTLLASDQVLASEKTCPPDTHMHTEKCVWGGGRGLKSLRHPPRFPHPCLPHPELLTSLAEEEASDPPGGDTIDPPAGGSQRVVGDSGEPGPTRVRDGLTDRVLRPVRHGLDKLVPNRQGTSRARWR